jgi:hypothetical protein
MKSRPNWPGGVRAKLFKSAFLRACWTRTQPIEGSICLMFLWLLELTKWAFGNPSLLGFARFVEAVNLCFSRDRSCSFVFEFPHCRRSGIHAQATPGQG